VEVVQTVRFTPDGVFAGIFARGDLINAPQRFPAEKRIAKSAPPLTLSQVLMSSSSGISSRRSEQWSR
jgi:hypothetical protein